MRYYVVEEQNLIDIADSVRFKSKTNEKMLLTDIPNKIKAIDFPITAFYENTTSGCHVVFGTVSDGNYTVALENCVLTGTNKMAFTYHGTKINIYTNDIDSTLKVSVYDARDFELKNYVINGNRGIAVVKKTTAPSDASVLKTGIYFGDVITIDMEQYGTYVVMAQRTGSIDVQVNGILIDDGNG